MSVDCDKVEETLIAMDELMRKLKSLVGYRFTTTGELEMAIAKTRGEYEVLSEKFCKIKTKD